MTNHQINFIGWILFGVSALGLITASVGRFWAKTCSVCVLRACLVLMIAVVRDDL